MKKICGIFIAIMMLSGNIYMTDAWGAYEKNLLIVSLLGISLVFFIQKNIRFIVNAPLIILISSFLFTSMISAGINSDIQLAMGALLIFMIYIVGGVLFPATYGNTVSTVDRAIWLGSLPLIVIPIIFERTINYPYSGIFYNPNSFGSVSATLFSLACARLTFYLDDYLFKPSGKIKNALTWGIISGIFLFFCFISASRTSAVVAISLIGLMLIFLLYKSLRNENKITFLSRLINIFLGMLCLYFILNIYMPINEVFQDVVLDKFNRYQGDILNHRGYLWTRALNDATLFGNGRGYFENIEIGAHSTYISVIGQFGIIPAVLLIMFLLVGAIQVYKYTLNQTHKLKFVPLSMTITFLSLSFAEGMFLKVSMLASFIFFGYCSVFNNHKSRILGE